MAMPEMLIAIPIVLLFQVPWIAGLVFAWLIYRRWRTAGARLTVLTLGLLILLGVALPILVTVIVPDAWGRVAFMSPSENWYTVFAVGFLSTLASVIVVLILGAALYRLMRDLAESRAREHTSNDASGR